MLPLKLLEAVKTRIVLNRPANMTPSKLLLLSLLPINMVILAKNGNVTSIPNLLKHLNTHISKIDLYISETEVSHETMQLHRKYFTKSIEKTSLALRNAATCFITWTASVNETLNAAIEKGKIGIGYPVFILKYPRKIYPKIRIDQEIYYAHSFFEIIESYVVNN